jgi:serine O-acetyltransferase
MATHAEAEEANRQTRGPKKKMGLNELISLVKSDLSRFAQTFALRGEHYSQGRVFWESLLFKAGFQAVLFYRISHWFFLKGWIHIAWFIMRLNITLTGAEIEFNAHIGPRMFIAHPVGIVIGRGTIIGSGVTLFQGVSFGVSSWHADEITKFPKVGDQCVFFANSTILGDITIGDNCIVAARAVVTCDMPEGSLAMGPPVQIYPDKGREKISSWSQRDI